MNNLHITRLLDPNNNLSKMTAAKQVLERLIRLFKLPHSIHDRLDLLLVVKPQHPLQLFARPIQNALERDVSLQTQQVCVCPVAGVVLLARQIANARNQAAETHAVKGFAQSLCATDFNDDVCALVARSSEHGLLPVWRLAVVDSRLGAEVGCALQLLVRRGRHDSISAGGRGDLTRRDADAAVALVHEFLALADDLALGPLVV